MNDPIEHDRIDLVLSDIKMGTYNKSDLSKKELISIIHQLACIIHALQSSLLTRTKYLSENMNISELEERVSDLERSIDNDDEESWVDY